MAFENLEGAFYYFARIEGKHDQKLPCEGGANLLHTLTKVRVEVIEANAEVRKDLRLRP